MKSFSPLSVYRLHTILQLRLWIDTEGGEPQTEHRLRPNLTAIACKRRLHQKFCSQTDIVF